MKFSLLVVCGLAATAEAFQVQPRLVTSRTAASSTPLSAMLDIREGVDRDVGTMEEWALSCGVQKVDAMQLTSEDGMDWSVMTTEDLPAGSPILAVPGNMILSSSQFAEEAGPVVEEAVTQLRRLGGGEEVPQFYLFLKIMAEYEKGDESPYFPWLNSLPRLYYNAVSMTNFCYECLPPLVFSLARAEKVKLDNFIAAMQKVDVLSPRTKTDPDLAKWVYNVVSTRCFGEGDKWIVPMADMFNHGTETEVTMQYDEEGNCNVFTTEDVPAGSPLRMSYGDPTNPSRLFATYGFLDQTSPATFCKIMTIKPNEELVNLGYDFSRMLFYKDTGAISEEVWNVMLYEVLKDNKPVQQAFYEAHMSGDVDTKMAIQQQYLLETSTALKTHVDTFLKQLDELSAKADGKDVNEHPRLPLILSHNEFVKTTFLTVKEQLDPLVEQAQASQEPAYN